jgi:hypothetical protein
MQDRIRWLAVASIALVVGVIAWRLLQGSYRGDIQRICFAQKNSGVDPLSDTHKVEEYAHDHLDTPEGSKWFTELMDKGVGERATDLTDEAKRLGITDCPLAKSYVSIKAQGEYRRDITTFCSDLTSIEQYDDDSRLAQMLDWIHTKAKSPRTQELADKLAQAAAPERPAVVRATTNDAGVYDCQVALVLTRPQSHPRKATAVVTLGDPQINGDLKGPELVTVLLPSEDDLQKCYDAGLARDPNLIGRVVLKFVIAAGGDVSRMDVDSTTTLPDHDVSHCIATTVQGVKFPAKSAAPNTVLLPIELIPNAAAAPLRPSAPPWIAHPRPPTPH